MKKSVLSAFGIAVALVLTPIIGVSSADATTNPHRLHHTMPAGGTAKPTSGAAMTHPKCHYDKHHKCHYHHHHHNQHRAHHNQPAG